MNQEFPIQQLKEFYKNNQPEFQFITDINKTHQYEEIGEINYGVPPLQTRNGLKTIKVGRQFS